MTDLRPSKRKRKGLSKKTRFEVFKRDKFACQYCGAHPPGVLLHVDHIVAVANGGANDIDNLVTACAPCNLGKGAGDLTAVPQSLKEKAQDIKEREAQLLGYHQVMEAKQERLDGEAWRVLHVMTDETSVPMDNYLSTKRFIERLGFHSVYEAMQIAVASRMPHYKVFRYFCGVCWNRIRALEAPSA